MKCFKFPLVAILCFSMILPMSACNGKDATETGGTSTKTENSTKSEDIKSTDNTKTDAPISSDKVELVYMNWAEGTEVNATQATLDRFNESQGKIHVSQISVPRDQYVAKINTLATSNALPDTAIMAEDALLKWAQAGILADMGTMFEGSSSAPLDSLAFKYDGKTVGWSCANEVLVLYYSRKLFDDAKIPYPPSSADKAWTWEEFVEVAKKLTKDKNGKTPNDPEFDAQNIVTYGANVDTTPWMWPVFALSNGGGLVSEDGSKLLINSPETIEAAQAIADLYLKDKVSPAPATLATFPTLDVTLLSGQVAMATGGQWNIGTSLINSLKDGLDYGVAVLPKFKRAVTYNTGGPNVIFNTTKHLDESYEFLKFFTKEENNLELIQSGVWMPVLKNWYTDPKLIDAWANNPEHPPLTEYKPAVIDYALNNASPVPWYYLPCYMRLQEVLEGGMAEVWLGTKTAKQAIDEMAPALQEIFDDGSAN